ncbi:hypothetical protein SDC9_161379 [bioreactor metagenome]|uniref:Uncharacterized protein n=1 Tax=bioreactor metagenome TaxID=1076179 RepID=A0A645FPD5_9ZZZZ
MVHARVVVIECPRGSLGEDQNADNQPQRQGNDDSEVEVLDAGGHLVVEAEVDQEVRRAHARHDDTQADQRARPQPDQPVRGDIDHRLTADQHDREDHDGSDCQDDPVCGSPALPAGRAIERREGPHHEADEQADKLRRETAERGVHDNREEHNTDDRADADRDEVEHILAEAMERLGQESDDRVIHAEDDRQHAAG